MSEKITANVLFRSKLLTEQDGPYAQHTGQAVMPTVDQNGNIWVIIGVNDGSGGGTNPFSLEAGYDTLDHQPNFNQTGVLEAPLAVVNHPYINNGSGTTSSAWDRQRSGSAANLAAQVGLGSALITNVGEWAVNHTPAAGVQATITRAAVAGTRHICKGVSFTFNAINAEAGTFLINLRDSTTGAGTILQSWRVGPFAAGGSMIFGYTDLNIVGTAGNAMTLEFAAAGAAGNFETVSLRGFDAT